MNNELPKSSAWNKELFFFVSALKRCACILYFFCHARQQSELLEKEFTLTTLKLILKFLAIKYFCKACKISVNHDQKYVFWLTILFHKIYPKIYLSNQNLPTVNQNKRFETPCVLTRRKNI